jgi:SAM-dependent methyltransferase
MRSLWIIVLVPLLCSCSCASRQSSRQLTELRPERGGYLHKLRRDSRALTPLVRSPWVRRFLDATRHLPKITPRRLYHDPERTQYFTEAEARRLPDPVRKKLRELKVDEEYYYSTRYGSPLAYARALDLAAGAGFSGLRGRKILDFGHGTIGHLRLMAMLGAQVTGVDVDPSLPKVYGQPGDQGTVRGPGDRVGSLQLVSGRFPAEESVRSAVGDGYDLFISKNTLKRGYIHPARPVIPPRRGIDLGVDDEAFVRAIFALLRPGGLAIIYNLHPAQSPPDKPYIPWADGKNPFARRLWQEAGFVLLVFDRDDTEFVRVMGRTMGWDRGEDAMDLQHDLFATYTVVRRPRSGPNSALRVSRN